MDELFAVLTEHKLIYAIAVTPAHVHDFQRLKTVLETVPKRGAADGYRGFDSAELRACLDQTARVPTIAFQARRRETEGMKSLRLTANKTIAKTRARRTRLWYDST